MDITKPEQTHEMLAIFGPSVAGLARGRYSTINSTYLPWCEQRLFTSVLSTSTSTSTGTGSVIVQ